MRLFQDYHPRNLFTYEVAFAREKIIEIPIEHSKICAYVKKHFGELSMDNKITIKLVNKDDKSKIIYATYWDGHLTIGTNVFFFLNIYAPENKHKTLNVKHPLHS